MIDFNTWKAQVLGHKIDIDGYYGDQCVDVAMSWAQFCYPGHKWPELIGYGDAKDLYGAANAAYFEKLKNIRPRQGDMVVYGATPSNSAGHIAVVERADANTITVIEQNGFNPTGVAYEEIRNYNNVIGYLRPRVGGTNTEGEEEMPTPGNINTIIVWLTAAAGKKRNATQAEINKFSKLPWGDFVNYVAAISPGYVQAQQGALASVQEALQQANDKLAQAGQGTVQLDAQTKAEISNTNTAVNKILDLVIKIANLWKVQ